MRVIAMQTLKKFFSKHKNAKQQLLAWYAEMIQGEWKNHNELKKQFRNASVINTKRVVFNIHGNDYRLIVDFEYKWQLIFIIWIGMHKQYDKIDIKAINYETD